MEQDDGRTLVLSTLAKSRTVAARWAWTGRIPLGAVTVLAGLPGLGKGVMSYDIGARITRGQLKGDFEDQPKRVLISSTEDVIQQVIRPRMVAAGADLDLVECLTVEEKSGSVRPLQLPKDLDILAECVGDLEDVGLILVDPLMAHLNANLDSHRDQDIRQALTPLMRIADEHQLAVVIIAHLNKNQSDEMFRRLGASIGIMAAARSVLIVASDPDRDEDGPDRVLAHGKCNVGPLMPAIQFRVEGRQVPTDDGGTMSTAGLAWGPEGTFEMAALLGKHKPGPKPEKRNEAIEWLRTELQGGARYARDLYARGEEKGLSEKVLKAAKTKLGIVVRQSGFGWTWELSDDHAS
jgi:archaellum biogenesis ATPase FlaH